MGQLALLGATLLAVRADSLNPWLYYQRLALRAVIADFEWRYTSGDAPLHPKTLKP